MVCCLHRYSGLSSTISHTYLLGEQSAYVGILRYEWLKKADYAASLQQSCVRILRSCRYLAFRSIFAFLMGKMVAIKYFRQHENDLQFSLRLRRRQFPG